jgi:beta-phosphoglucomutase-like phosphatase (HAD superfamily)
LFRTSAFLDLTHYEGVLFDVDGTLTHSDDLHFRAFQELLVDKGYGGVCQVIHVSQK